MKILMVALFDTGACGPTSVLKQIITHINRQKNNHVDIFSPYPFDSRKQELAKAIGAEYYFCDRKIITKETLNEIIPRFPSYDIFHIHGIYEYRNWMIARILYKEKRKYVVSVHGNLMPAALKKSYIKKCVAIMLFIRNMLTHASRIHALTEEERNAIFRLIRKENITVIYNGVELNSPRRKVDYCFQGLSILFIGRIDVCHKGIDLLFNMLKHVKPEILNEIHIDFIGPFERKKDEIYVKKFLFSNENINPHVNFLGPCYGEEKEEKYSKYKFFIHTSRYEGMPMAVLEAMGRGMPPIISMGTNMGNIIENNKLGYVIKSNTNFEELALKLLNLDYSEIEEMGEKCRNWCKENLKWDKISKLYLTMYKEN